MGEKTYRVCISVLYGLGLGCRLEPSEVDIGGRLALVDPGTGHRDRSEESTPIH